MRIQDVNASTESEALAIRTHIYVDWINGQAGEIQFDVQRYYRDKETGAYFAVDGSQEPPIRVSFDEILPRMFTNPPERGGGTFPGAFIAACIKTVYESLYDEARAPKQPESLE